MKSAGALYAGVVQYSLAEHQRSFATIHQYNHHNPGLAGMPANPGLNFIQFTFFSTRFWTPCA
jgi:hypothetical protein